MEKAIITTRELVSLQYFRFKIKQWFPLISIFILAKPKILTASLPSDIIVQFLDNPDNNSILFYLNIRDDLVPAIKFPAQLKKKSVYFLKNREGAQVTEKLDHELAMGDLPPNPLDFLGALLEEVYLPLLSNPKNLDSWPEVVANDVVRHFHRINGAVFVISGRTKVT